MIKYYHRQYAIELLKYYSDKIDLLISINDTEEEAEEIRSHSHVEGKVLSIIALDTQDGLTKADCERIITAVNSVSKDGFIAVHCFLGASRSPAVARFICEHLGVDDRDIMSYPYYNRSVYESLVNYKNSKG